ncbi:sensor histidine kinase [Paenibacillus sp. DMB20]|uniref:sensor histidine kinase n=1 Tax=Paenibacillus sp. DMB20 TaxID=1642570 RepID=UPI00069A61E9|nr:MHYT domain-containing protein [Paenibacillus sp. DMB20]
MVNCRMPQVVDRYNDWIVLLSVFIAVTSAYTAFDLMDWVLFKNRKSLWWTFLISFALGIGIWSMHFIGMLAMKTVISVTYEPSMLLISLFLPILASFFAMLLVFIDRSISRIQFILSGFLITMAIVSMHFAGMLSMNVPLLYRQSAYPMVLSVIIVLLASYSGLYLGIYRSERRTFSHLTLPKIMGALILGLAVSGMHYTALAGTTFNALDRNHSLSGTGVNSTLLAIMVSAATLLIISFILTGLYLDRREVLYSARFNEKRYMTLFELNPDLVICVDPKKQRILSVNPAVLANTGYTAEEVMALPLESLFWSRRDHLIMLSAVQRASEGNPRQVEIRMKNKLGEMVIQSATVFPLDTQRQQLLYIITKDVTEQRLSEKELLAAKEAAESAARMKSEFLATMSHELRTPLNGIIGINQLLADGEEDEGRRELLELQSKSSHALLNVINDILDLSKMEAGKVKLVREKFSIRSLIEECYDLFEVISRDKAIAMRFYLNPDVPDTVIGDQMRLRQILVNLIGNALKFTDEGFISLTVKKIGRDNGRYTLEFNVTDTGIGIEPDKVELLFKPFSQLDGAQHRKYEGTGLGLAICRKLVEMMNGEIWVVPEVARGPSLPLGFS